MLVFKKWIVSTVKDFLDEDNRQLSYTHMKNSYISNLMLT